MSKAQKYSPEFREEAVRMVIETQRPIAHIAKELGLNSETLRLWVKRYREEKYSQGPEMSLDERARLRELERINRQQAMEIEFLKKAAAYFAKDAQ